MFTRRKFWGAVLELAAMALLLGGVGTARASLIIAFSQDGANVDAVGTGSLNFLGLSFSGFDFNTPFVKASAATVLLGKVPPVYTDAYSGSISGPSTFGSGGSHAATSGASAAPGGTGAGIDAADGRLFVPGGYASGDSFTVSSIWESTTINDLGLTPGTYTWTWGSEAQGTADSLTVVVPSSVPEPASLALLSIAGLAWAGCGRRKRVTA